MSFPARALGRLAGVRDNRFDAFSAVTCGDPAVPYPVALAPGSPNTRINPRLLAMQAPLL
jgi:hypothetical protein